MSRVPDSTLPVGPRTKTLASHRSRRSAGRSCSINDQSENFHRSLVCKNYGEFCMTRYRWCRQARLVTMALAASCLLSIPGMAEPELSKLWVIVVADVTSPDIASPMHANKIFLEMILRLNVVESRYKIIDSGPHYSRKSILDELAALKSDLGPDDAILFMYFGHGAYHPARGTFFTPPADRGRPVYISEILGAMADLKPRLRVAIVDCCNLIASDNRMLPSYGSPVASETSILFDRLFFRDKGEVYINSSSIGEAALTRRSPSPGHEPQMRGSVFMSAFFQVFGRTSRTPLWTEIVKELRSKTKKEFDKSFHGGARLTIENQPIVQTTQTVVGHINGVAVP
jgi:hypothetical protein